MDKVIEEALIAIVGGCRNVKETSEVHQDAKDLATEVIKDINKILRGEAHNV